MSLLRWEKSTTAISCVEEADSIDTVWANKIGSKVYEIVAKCPHCSGVNTHREIIGTSSIKETIANAKKHKYIFNYEPPYSANTGGNNLALAYDESDELNMLTHAFDEIESTQTEDDQFVTLGCPSCQKRYSIVIDINKPAEKS